ncbi:MAG: hydrogenase maturation nickel metallochaperone HypA [Anaerolineae bacterium]|nr:hydrogenase maturation nickel metallochaperone HypA [Anaerolineae bacterium]MCA9893469.1 hydrogenase maturation nickel metallochaperone HypA [Anaerolineae bacterium]
MHELPVTQSMLDIALRYGEQNGATRITNLYLVIGDLSSIIDDSVQFYWDIISRGTIAEGAKLHFERIPTRMVCFECSHTYLPEPGTLACPNCGSTRVQVAAGDEFRLDALDIETEGADS